MEKVISTYRRLYRMEYFECDNGLYKFAIYDNEGHVQDPRFFKNCDVKDSIAINLTRYDIKEFITTVKNYCDSAIKEEIMEDFNIIYKNDKEWLGVYELSIYDNMGYNYDPRELMECTVDGYWTINLTNDNVNAFFDSIIEYNHANQKR